MLEPRLEAHVAKTGVFTMFLLILEGVLLLLKNEQNGPDDGQDGTKMASSPPVMVQIVQIITHPVAQMIEERSYVKPPT